MLIWGGVVELFGIPSGTKCFDWIVPDEWNVKDAYIITPSGQKICNFKENNLHLLGYSEPINLKLSLNELNKHLYSLENIPNAVPYVTSYYERRWGFCISQNERYTLKDGIYHVFIDSSFDKNGVLNYAKATIKATKPTNKTILISTYLCHPSMANNELSGPVVWAELFKFISSLKHRNYNYEFIIIPETIGSIVYISQNFERLKRDVVGGFVLTCIGDERAYSVVLGPSKQSLSDKVALHTIKHITHEPKIYSFLMRGSDERQFNSPLVNLGVATLCRSKFGEYLEYHTSLDDLNLVTKNGLYGGLNYAKNCILNLESNKTYILTTICEPNLGSRGLIQTISSRQFYTKDMMRLRNFLAFCDGKRDAIEIAEILDVELRTLVPIIETLLNFKLIKEIER